MKIVKSLGMFAIYFCIATLIAQAIGLALFWNSGSLNSEKVRNIIAVMQGTLPAPTPTEEADIEAADRGTPYDRLRQAGDLQARDLEIREQAVRDEVVELTRMREELTADVDNFLRAKGTFEQDLADLETGARAQARDDVRLILENMDPVQAKNELLMMLASDEMDEVVLMLAGMHTSKKAKIISEFKTPEETKDLDEILRRTRLGQPKTDVIEQARASLGTESRPSPSSPQQDQP